MSEGINPISNLSSEILDALVELSRRRADTFTPELRTRLDGFHLGLLLTTVDDVSELDTIENSTSKTGSSGTEVVTPRSEPHPLYGQDSTGTVG